MLTHHHKDIFFLAAQDDQTCHVRTNMDSNHSAPSLQSNLRSFTRKLATF